jgi:GT2 family glycosyltransferase
LALPFNDVVVVNNASTDGTAQWLDQFSDPRLRVIHSDINCGGAGGFARGFSEVAHQTTADWLVCYDDDAYPAPNALQNFSSLELDANVGGVAAAVYLPDGKISAMNRPGLNPFGSPRLLWRALWRRTNRFGIPDVNYQREEMQEVSYSSFVGLFVRCDLIRECFGLPRAELFIYGDDTLYTLGISQSGYKLAFAPTVRFLHDCRTLVQQRRVYQPSWKAYYVIRNGLSFYKRLTGGYFYPIMLPILLLSWLAPARNYENVGRFFRLSWSAILDGLRGDFSKSHGEVTLLSRK